MTKRRIRAGAVGAAILAAGVLAAPAQASVGVTYQPSTDPDLSCPWANHMRAGHHGDSFSGTWDTEFGRVTFSVPHP